MGSKLHVLCLTRRYGAALQGRLFILVHALDGPQLGEIAGTMSAALVKANGGFGFAWSKDPSSASSTRSHIYQYLRTVRFPAVTCYFLRCCLVAADAAASNPIQKEMEWTSQIIEILENPEIRNPGGNLKSGNLERSFMIFQASAP